ncbi:MAG TPA: hypothetical protein VNK52_03505 [Hyphomicrobiaceae bacterium]|nr:hypothetical protein [Hyphomicrobiaceae bacterium]
METLSGILEEAAALGEQSLWALLWAATAICLLSLAFAAVERVSQQARNGAGASAIAYQGKGRTLGLTLMVLGVGGVLVSLIAWGAMFGDVGQAFRLLVRRVRDVTDGSQLAVLAAVIASMVVFDIGAFKYLGSERRTPASAP